MPGEELLRNLYPDVLALTPDGINGMAGRDRVTREFLLGICDDLEWLKSRRGLVGWVARANPFLRMDAPGRALRRLTAAGPRGTFALRGGAWFGIGTWPLAERYYKRAVRKAVCRDDGTTAVHAGLRLGAVYLGAEDLRSAERLARHLLGAIERSHGGGRGPAALHAGAILCLALIGGGRYGEAEQEAARLRAPGAARRWTALEASLYRPLAGTFWSTGRPAELERWQERWWDLEQLVRGVG